MFKKVFNYFNYSVLGAALGFLTTIFLTRSLPPEEFGYLGLFSSLIFFIFPFLSFRAEGLVGINRVQLSASDYCVFRNVYISFSAIIFTISLAVIFSICWFFYPNYLYLFIITLMIGFVRIFIAIHSTELIQDHKSRLFGRLNLLNSLLVFAATVFLVGCLELSWQGRLLAILGVELLVVLVRILFFSDLGGEFSFNLNRNQVKAIVIYGLPLYVALGLSWIIFEADKIIVLSFFSMEQLGYYTLAYSVAGFLNHVNQAVSNAMVPTIYNNLNEGRGSELIKRYNLIYSGIIISISSFSSVFFIMFSGWIFGAQYEESAGLIAVVIFAFAFSGIYRTSGVVINFFKLNILKTKILFVCASMNLLISIAFIPQLGLYAPAWGTLASFFLLAAISYYFSRREMDCRDIKE